MTVSKSPRLGLTRWSSDDDPWLRSDWDGDNAQLESLAAMTAEGTLAARPAPDKGGRFYRATDTNELYYDTGTGWLLINRTDDAEAAVTLGSGITNTATDSSKVYRRSGMATLVVNVNTDAAGPGMRSTFLTVPTGYRPIRDLPFPLRDTAGRLTVGWLYPTGVFLTSTSATPAAVTNVFGTVSYPLP